MASGPSWNRRYLITSLLLLLAIAGCFFGVWYVSQKIRQTVADINGEIARQRLRVQRLDKMSGLETTNASVLRRKEMFTLKVPKDDTVRIITQLEGLAEATGNEIVIDVADKPKSLVAVRKKIKKPIDVANPDASQPAVDPETEKLDALKEEIKKNESITFSVRLRGSYESVHSYMRKLENLGTLILINDVVIFREVAGAQRDGANPFLSAGSGQTATIGASGESDGHGSKVNAEVMVTFFVE